MIQLQSPSPPPYSPISMCLGDNEEFQCQESSMTTEHQESPEHQEGPENQGPTKQQKGPVESSEHASAATSDDSHVIYSFKLVGDNIQYQS